MIHLGSDPHKDLARLLRTKSVRFGKFTLASGKESDFFIDCKQAILDATGHLWAGQVMLEAVASNFPDAKAVAGVELGGCPLASAVSLLSAVSEIQDLPALYVRKAKKDHGTGALVEGKGSLPAGTPVVLLEDVFTTGGSSLRAIQTLKNEGFEVLGVVGLVNRNEGADEAFKAAGIEAIAIYTKEQFLE
jgi:orotate phosphoribosyltransferase